ncbi:hypothetical protein PVAP13_9NG297573 [Panicum virgatum]|uniref:Uncharacterized protein n=1 Tax=Panicum virgatum TaxID=38727 RepID=A0A8T0MRR7_PANVG|nr:hypothetical protein PVAP13_9NG297573 [Panicum virgatum]
MRRRGSRQTPGGAQRRRPSSQWCRPRPLLDDFLRLADAHGSFRQALVALASLMRRRRQAQVRVAHEAARRTGPPAPRSRRARHGCQGPRAAPRARRHRGARGRVIVASGPAAVFSGLSSLPNSAASAPPRRAGPPPRRSSPSSQTRREPATTTYGGSPTSCAGCPECRRRVGGGRRAEERGGAALQGRSGRGREIRCSYCTCNCAADTWVLRRMGPHVNGATARAVKTVHSDRRKWRSKSTV